MSVLFISRIQCDAINILYYKKIAYQNQGTIMPWRLPQSFAWIAAWQIYFVRKPAAMSVYKNQTNYSFKLKEIVHLSPKLHFKLLYIAMGKIYTVIEERFLFLMCYSKGNNHVCLVQPVKVWSNNRTKFFTKGYQSRDYKNPSILYQ